MRSIHYAAQFKRDMKQAKKRGKDIQKLMNIMQLLIDSQPLSVRLRDHVLVGDWKPRRELHIEPDWLLIYFADDEII